MIRFVWPPTVIVNRTQSAGGFQPWSGFADGQSTEQLARKDVQVALIVYLYNEHKRSPMNVGNAWPVMLSMRHVTSIRPQSTPLVLKHHLASTRWITMHAVRLLTRAQMNDKALERRRVYVKLTSTMGEHVDYCSQRMDNHWYAD
ncbi:hypothetical protein T4B_10798 [Trichinella pseudospiralis]|uniref:Uncharacterized protein n=2 Tax=Trichinella pseudospiralis TaxID=6337 RepID=A0A0V1E2L8_TRIPS|nr:hypothetical protein T4A_8791 [Trichinella pseudospiralis]KRY90078.1 hypothetical protein T4D_8662 [Trichinella pseudospiralis]KRZ25144.1 hypothetical protein T4B_10798 [Trichinella pseudospiralis]KRZ28798.1 hypothetical protein T4C_10895 [Trichinella pseudospiralis]